ncbi:two-component system regulatory protein YycI [Herbivorax sp. ANBcel31]|uniref:two-component system regulatory protein YycI n=1 Tax=Herbivorax sp. ANBcel31 TaxID=3069754 RepID=UPI0027AE4795|nr:two-component system regulatory protein YycI [Herbivorax sp. ANBcel31]MDQ2087497.1 two-component system regulatory protein YycI [Herbivorax sp. ANBcel31]
MDWSKAKSILIVIFISLNLFLGVVLIRAISEEGISQETIDNVKKALLNRGVVVNSEIPLYNKKTGTLPYRDESIDKLGIFENFLDIEKEVLNRDYKDKNQIEIEGKKIIFQNSDKFIYKDKNLSDNISVNKNSEEVFDNLKFLFEGTDIPVSEFEFDKKEDESTYMFRQKYNDFWIFENYISVRMSKEGVAYLECRYRKTDDIIQGNEILSAYQVLIKNHENIKDIEIIAIDLGFKEHIIEDGTMELNDIPVWRVRTSNKEEMFFRVYDGEKVTSQN